MQMQQMMMSGGGGQMGQQSPQQMGYYPGSGNMSQQQADTSSYTPQATGMGGMVSMSGGGMSGYNNAGGVGGMRFNQDSQMPGNQGMLPDSMPQGAGMYGNSHMAGMKPAPLQQARPSPSPRMTQAQSMDTMTSPSFGSGGGMASGMYQQAQAQAQAQQRQQMAPMAPGQQQMPNQGLGNYMGGGGQMPAQRSMASSPSMGGGVPSGSVVRVSPQGPVVCRQQISPATGATMGDMGVSQQVRGNPNMGGMSAMGAGTISNTQQQQQQPQRNSPMFVNKQPFSGAGMRPSSGQMSVGGNMMGSAGNGGVHAMPAGYQSQQQSMDGYSTGGNANNMSMVGAGLAGNSVSMMPGAGMQPGQMRVSGSVMSGNMSTMASAVAPQGASNMSGMNSQMGSMSYQQANASFQQARQTQQRMVMSGAGGMVMSSGAVPGMMQGASGQQALMGGMVVPGQRQQQQQQQQQQQANETEKGKDKGRATGKENKKEGGDKSRPADGKVPNKTGANALAEKLPGQMHTTVFVRGLHLDVTKQDVQLKLSRFGSIKSCRLVMDKITGKLKGTAFVDFENKDAAERCASASKRKPGDKLGGISLNGTPLVIDVALTQDGARSLATQRAEAGGKSDKRNLHLSKEGVINAGTEAWEKLSAGDKAKRERAVEERKAKLKNPNMYCSTTRLLIRNVPKDFDEAQLKAVCSKMVKERAKKAKPQIKHAKILMDAGDGKGTPRSRGRAFVEFEDAEHALVCLRQMNNNPAPFGPATRPIVEFAVEDARLKRKMALKVAHVKGSGKRAPQGGEDDAGAAAQLSKLEKKRAWKAKLREKIAERKATKAPADGEEEDRPPAGKKAKAAEAGRGKKRRQAPEGGEQPAAKSPRTDGKRGAKGGAAGGAPLDAATAKGAAKAKRMREQAAREQAHHVKKRREDDLLDRLADDGNGGAGRQQPRKGKNKPKKKEPTDKLDALVGEYTKKLFGGASKGDGAGGGRKAALARWFE